MTTACLGEPTACLQITTIHDGIKIQVSSADGYSHITMKHAEAQRLLNHLKESYEAGE